jgi:hypothetical protein
MRHERVFATLVVMRKHAADEPFTAGICSCTAIAYEVKVNFPHAQPRVWRRANAIKQRRVAP